MEVYFSTKIEWTFVIMNIKGNKEESCFKINICDIIVKVDMDTLIAKCLAKEHAA